MAATELCELLKRAVTSKDGAAKTLELDTSTVNAVISALEETHSLQSQLDQLQEQLSLKPSVAKKLAEKIKALEAELATTRAASRVIDLERKVQRLEAELKQSYASKNFTLKSGLLEIEKRYRDAIYGREELEELWGEVTLLITDDKEQQAALAGQVRRTARQLAASALPGGGYSQGATAGGQLMAVTPKGHHRALSNSEPSAAGPGYGAGEAVEDGLMGAPGTVQKTVGRLEEHSAPGPLLLLPSADTWTPFLPPTSAGPSRSTLTAAARAVLSASPQYASLTLRSNSSLSSQQPPEPADADAVAKAVTAHAGAAAAAARTVHALAACSPHLYVDLRLVQQQLQGALAAVEGLTQLLAACRHSGGDRQGQGQVRASPSASMTTMAAAGGEVAAGQQAAQEEEGGSQEQGPPAFQGVDCLLPLAVSLEHLLQSCRSRTVSCVAG
ncbi:hypothetical protein V8C86DRAFT_1677915 [Haematococcus lacustris]